MTGGAGFARQGSDSFKQNRALRNKRKRMSDSPYINVRGVKGKRNADFDFKAIQKFREDRRRKSRIITIVISTTLIVLAILLLAIT
ncbi:hypothetical protein [Marivirga arenosa]|uniref:Uncharacterized protein n=1 Tax=Marivirga arenosa TaxID=3059076 RepID=A0AA49GJT9_9BACT|nr:hypothetical protein [Marivirga sp. BKB1-2]WKK82827.1 hypothetical protein QYS47_12945 [Marivirga sp. BKB1-2]